MKLFLLFACLLIAPAVIACPFCESETASAIRYSLKQHIGSGIFALLLPLALIAVCVWVLFHKIQKK